jgi:hypothetical protein
MATSDVLQDNTIRQGSVVTQPSHSASFSSVKASRTRNEFPLTQPIDLMIRVITLVQML